MSRARSVLVCLLVLLAGIPLAAGPIPPLLDAVKVSDVATVRALLQKGADVNAPDVEGTTALDWAARLDAGAVADLLIRAGAHPNTVNRYGVTALALAAANGSGEMIERLLKAGADPNRASAGGETVLMTAARSGSVAGVTHLLARGADVEAKEPRRGTNALMWAAEENHAPIDRKSVV